MTQKQFFAKWRYDDVLGYSMDRLLSLVEYYGFYFDIVDDILTHEREAELEFLRQMSPSF